MDADLRGGSLKKQRAVAAPPGRGGARTCGAEPRAGPKRRESRGVVMWPNPEARPCARGGWAVWAAVRYVSPRPWTSAALDGVSAASRVRGRGVAVGRSLALPTQSFCSCLGAGSLPGAGGGQHGVVGEMGI